MSSTFDWNIACDLKQCSATYTTATSSAYESRLYSGGQWVIEFDNFFIITVLSHRVLLQTGTHLQVDEEWFIQPIHPFQCLPGVITGQEEGTKHKASHKTMDKHSTLKTGWDVERYMKMTVNHNTDSQHLKAAVRSHFKKGQCVRYGQDLAS